jgi:hypothetical protein
MTRWWPPAPAARKGGAPRPRSQATASATGTDDGSHSCAAIGPDLVGSGHFPHRGHPWPAKGGNQKHEAWRMRGPQNRTQRHPGTSRDAYATLGPRCGSSTGVPYMNPTRYPFTLAEHGIAQPRTSMGPVENPVLCEGYAGSGGGSGKPTGGNTGGARPEPTSLTPGARAAAPDPPARPTILGCGRGAELLGRVGLSSTRLPRVITGWGSTAPGSDPAWIRVATCAPGWRCRSRPDRSPARQPHTEFPPSSGAR